MSAKINSTIIEESSGDVFQDLGFSSVEATDLRLRSDLLIRLNDLIKAHGGSQTDVARLLGISQPRVSDLLRGKIHKFSLDTLVAFAGRLGADVAVTVHSPDDSDAATLRGYSDSATIQGSYAGATAIWLVGGVDSVSLGTWATAHGAVAVCRTPTQSRGTRVPRNLSKLVAEGAIINAKANLAA